MSNSARAKRQLLRFILCFFLINILLALLVGINYIHVLPNFQTMTDGHSYIFILFS